VIEPIANQHELRLLGIDFSLAPYPEPLRSVGVALEALGLQGIGLPGSLTAVGFLADCLDRAEFPRTGFCGVFLPVLEDTALAEAASEKRLSLGDLLLYAGVCGAGLDTVPLPGDTPTASLTALLMDVGTLSLRQDKPLTARLMPIPDKESGDAVNFDFPYFAPSRVMEIPGARPKGLLGGSEDVLIGPIPHRR
jgi:uncharacterized protein (UPF0210 family)